MINILITGGAGFIASSLAEELLQNKKYFVVLIDNLLTGKKENIPISKRCKFFKIDVNIKSQLKEVMNEFDFDYIFHYAAVVGVERTVQNPLLVFKDIDGLKKYIIIFCIEKNKKNFFPRHQRFMGSLCNCQCMRLKLLSILDCHMRL